MHNRTYPWYLWLLAIIAIAFGVLTLKSGGAVLFGDGEARAAAGDYVPFVLWFNFVAGFFYILAGIGILLRKSCAAWLALVIAVLTLAVYAAFGLHVLNGGAYEVRTAIAMAVRSTVWLLIAFFTYRWHRVIKHSPLHT